MPSVRPSDQSLTTPRRHRRRIGGWRSAGVTTACLLLGWNYNSAATVQPRRDEVAGPRAWAGSVRIASQTWSFDVRESTSGLEVSVPSLWVPATPVAVASDPVSRLRFSFPRGLGEVDVTLEGPPPFAGSIRGGQWGDGRVQLAAVPATSLVYEDVLIGGAGVTIGATVTRPSSWGRRPAVVVLHGGGDSSREDSPGYRFWGEHLARLGLVAVTYDKRGNGQSTGSWRTVGFTERAQDVERLVAWLRGRADVDASQVGLLAVSQGTWVASLAAASDPQLTFLVQLAGPAVSPLEADTYASIQGWRRTGLQAAELRQAERLWRMEVAAIRSGPGSSAWRRYDRAVSAAGMASWYVKARYSPADPTSWFATWYRLVAAHEPARAIADTQAPSLWVYGDRDTQSDMARNVRTLRQLRQSARTAIDTACFPNADHGLNTPAGRDATGPVTVAPGFFDLVDGWIRRHVGMGPSPDGGAATPRASIACAS